MSALKELITNKKVLVPLTIIMFIILLPLFEVIIKIIFSYGTLIGTYGRYIYERKICLGFI